MQDFTRPAGRLRPLPVGARAVYSVFLVFTLLGLVLTLVLTHDMVGIDLARVDNYYAGDTAPAEYVEPDGGPELVLPPGGEELAAFEPIPHRKLLEVTHFHLFSMPVYLLILSHLFMLSRARRASKATWITLASLGTLLHVAAPWVAAQAMPGAVAVYGISGVLMLVSYAVMSTLPLWEMWRS